MVDALSYGGGHQTAGMLALIKLGRLPKPDVIIFADTGGEIPETYHHIENYAKPLADELGIPFQIVAGNLKGKGETLYEYSWNKNWIPQPFSRSCTKSFKVEPIHKALRSYKGKEAVNVWIGISLDEARRRKTAFLKWITNIYPLVDNGLTRADCDEAMRTIGMPIPPKSGCYFCPFNRTTRWREIRMHTPDLYQKAIALEENARQVYPNMTLTGKAPLKAYLEGEQLAWEELLEAEEGCHTGYCFV